MTKLAQPPRHNPAFLGDEGIVSTFVARSHELASILAIVRANTRASNQHALVIGPRGAGKTTLVLRVAAEVRRDTELARAVYPLVFSEETYEVHDAASLWLEALGHLGRQTGATRWRDAYTHLRRETDPVRLRTLALAELRAFSDAEGKRLLIVVENFNTVLGRQIGDDEAWTLRHTLLGEPWIMLLATATSRFDGIDRGDQAMFDLFRVLDLAPLSSFECAALWLRLTGTAIDERQGRAIEILTGGSPRLVTILSRLAGDAPLADLADDLTRLIDDHTDYFRSNIEALSRQEQRVFAVLAELWAPATAHEVAERSRLPVNTSSAVLSRLEEAGVVTANASAPRRKRYQLSERLYNIYYLLRRGGGEAERVRFAVEFIAAYYDPNTLVEKLIALAVETAESAPPQRRDKLAAFFGLYEKLAGSHGGLIHERLPSRFIELPDLSDEQRRRLHDDRAVALRDQTWFLSLITEWWASHRVLSESLAAARARPAFKLRWEQLQDAVAGKSSIGTATQALISDPAVWRSLRKLLPRLKRICRDALRDRPSGVDIFATGALALWQMDETLERRTLDAAGARWPASPFYLLARAWYEHVVDGEDPLRFAAQAAVVVAEHPENVWLPLVAGLILDFEERPAEAAMFYRRSPVAARLPELTRALVEIHEELLDYEPDIVLSPRYSGLASALSTSLWRGLYVFLARTAARLERWEDAEVILRAAREGDPDNPELNLSLGTLLCRRPERAAEGLMLLRRATEASAPGWQLGAAIGIVLAYPLRQPDAALTALRASWRSYCASGDAPAAPVERVESWLFSTHELLLGYSLPERLLALLKVPPAPLEEAWARLLAASPNRSTRQELIFVAMALAAHRDPGELARQLRGSPVGPRAEPLVVALEMSAGRELNATPVIAEPAKDIAATIRLVAGLLALTREAS